MGVLVIARLGQRVDGEREGFGEQHEGAGAVSGVVRHSDHGGSLWSADGLKSDRLGFPDPAGPQRDGRRLLGLVVVADHADCGATSEHAGSQQCTHCGGDFLDGTDIVATHKSAMSGASPTASTTAPTTSPTANAASGCSEIARRTTPRQSSGGGRMV